jgi:Tol biopolymer transport system component
MTTEQRFERELPDILADLYPVRAPDYRNDLVQRIAAKRQRPAWALPERWIPMTALAVGRSIRPMPWRAIGVLALLLLSIAAVAIIAGSQRRLPAPFGPAANGTLVFAQDGDIFLVDPATGIRTLAIGGPATDANPIFSRDGTKLAFLREVDGRLSIMLAGERGQQARELSTTVDAEFGNIEWSPDGTSIMTNVVEDGVRSIAIVPTDGSPARVLDIDVAAEDPVWLPPSGREILFRTQNPLGERFGYSLSIVGADGANVRELVPSSNGEFDALFFSPSPDGRYVAYQHRDAASDELKVHVIPVGRGTPRVVTSRDSVNPLWSPDGTWIAYWGPEGNHIVRADGTSPELRVNPVRGGIRWAPDGDRLLFFGGGESAGVLIDPLGGPDATVPWAPANISDWQRLAPNP